MPDSIFYVGAQRHRSLTGYVPAKFLMRNGSYVVDPMRGGSQDAYFYSDRLGSNKTNGSIANPNNYLVVPANYSVQKARDFAGQIADSIGGTGVETGTGGLGQALGQMAGAFLPGGSQDLQRNPQWGIPKGSMVPAFIGSASNHLGYVTGLAGLPMSWSEIGGGVHNGVNAAWQSVKGLAPRVLHLHSGHINTDGPYWLSSQNYANILQGFNDGIAARQPPAPFNDYGYPAQAPRAPGQIGDGNGIASFPASLAGINPDEPAPPAWPPGQDRPVRYLSAHHVRY